MDILNETLEKIGARITSRRVSFKLNFDGTYSENRVIYKIEPSSNYNVEYIMNQYTKDKSIIEYMVRRNDEEHGDFGMLFDETSVRFYIDSPFKENQDGIHSVKIENGISTKRVYEVKYVYDFRKFEILFPIYEYLNMRYIMSRNDGQDYVRFKSTPPYEALAKLTNHDIMNEWIKKYIDRCDAVWLQLSEESFTLYFKKE